jgi:hypothetical protein
MQAVNIFRLLFFVGMAGSASGLRAPAASGGDASQLLSFGRLCALISGVQQPQVYIFYPDKSLCLEILCAAGFVDLTPVEECAFNLLLKTCKKRTFSAAKRNSGRNILVDEYISKMPFLWKLKCPYELKQVIKYFKLAVTKLGLPPTPDVPLLISLDYGAHNTGGLCKTNHQEVAVQSMDQKVTEEEVEFLQRYFNVLSGKDAHIIFALYHRLLAQMESMKTSAEFLRENAGIVANFAKFIQTSLKELGVVEVLYRLLLLESIFFFSQKTGLDLSFSLNNWVLEGARRGRPANGPCLNARGSSTAKTAASSTNSMVAQNSPCADSFSKASSVAPRLSKKRSLPLGVPRGSGRLPPCMRRKTKKH